MDFYDEIEAGLDIAGKQLGQIDVLIDLFDFTLAWLSEGTAAIAGQSADDIIGKAVSDVTFLSNQMYASFVKSLVADAQKIYKVPVKANDGTTVYYEAEHYLVELKGCPRFIAVKVLGTQKQE